MEVVSTELKKEKRPAAAAPARKAPAEDHGIPTDLPKPRTWMIALMVGLLVLLMGGLFVLGWVPHHAAEEQAKGDAQEVAGGEPTVFVAKPKKSPATSELVLPCDLRANQETAIYPRTSGYLKARYVDIQAHVKAGDVLAEIDSPEVDAQLLQAKGSLEQAKAGVEKAKADLQLAQRTVARYHDIQKTGAGTVTRQEVEEKENTEAQASSAVAQSNANVVAADAAVKRLVVLQSFEKVVAPFSGTITERNYDVGALLSSTDTSPGKEMFRIAETETLRAFVRVPQVYAGQIKIGSEGKLTANEREFSGTVARSSDAVDPNTLTLLFELHFPNKKGELYPGMYGKAKLELTQAQPTLLIPTTALRFDAGGVRVVVVEDGKAHFQKVRPGRDLGTQLEIVDGLSANSEVVTNPGEMLTEGSPVKVADGEKSIAAAKGPAGQASRE